VPLVDLARLLPDDPTLYTDGVHFTAAGNAVRARHIAAALAPLVP
jgi:lysophospholipase L1-like esterase